MIVIIVAIFISNSNKTTGNVIVCNKPYILVGTSCCLDQNSDGICDNEETTITPQSISDIKKLSIDEIKSIVYQAIRKYIPKSTIGGFEDYNNYANTRCGEQWFYPSKNEDASKNVIASIIYHCKAKNDIYTPEEWLSLFSNTKPSEDYLKSLDKGKVLIHNKIWDDINREDYSISFACQNFWIDIYTQDFYGDNAWTIYKDYNIDKVAMENIVNEILSKC